MSDEGGTRGERDQGDRAERAGPPGGHRVRRGVRPGGPGDLRTGTPDRLPAPGRDRRRVDVRSRRPPRKGTARHRVGGAAGGPRRRHGGRRRRGASSDERGVRGVPASTGRRSPGQAHPRGGANAARAAELVAGDDRDVGADVIERARWRATPAVVDVLRRYPPHRPAEGASGSCSAISMRPSAGRDRDRRERHRAGPPLLRHRGGARPGWRAARGRAARRRLRDSRIRRPGVHRPRLRAAGADLLSGPGHRRRLLRRPAGIRPGPRRCSGRLAAPPPRSWPG